MIWYVKGKGKASSVASPAAYEIDGIIADETGKLASVDCHCLTERDWIGLNAW